MSEGDRPRRPDRGFDYSDFGPPIRVSGGMRARSQRGEIARTWWSRRFVEALEQYYGSDASRLARGRTYARAGQVIDIELSAGVVTASVQGSRPKPYAVRIAVRELDDVAWRKAETAMAARAVFLARLLAGEMPDEIEEAFDAAKVRLFPARRGDLVTSCSCPDTANPCKHIAAVYYLLAESFDVDPFLIFEWRGRPRERLISELRALRPSASRADGAPRKPRVDATATPLGFDRTSTVGFWHGGSWSEVPIEARPTSPPDALLRDAEADVVATLGAEAIADLRSLYLRAAVAGKRRLDPSATESARDVRQKRRRRS